MPDASPEIFLAFNTMVWFVICLFQKKHKIIGICDNPSEIVYFLTQSFWELMLTVIMARPLGALPTKDCHIKKDKLIRQVQLIYDR